MLSELGIPVASLVAGLGIGGLAIALAGQKTVEHLFGTVSIGFDQPFAEGDFVSIDGTVGTVETIGLRSTRIRTLDRTLVTIPNGLLAEMRSEVFSVRDRIRLYTTIGLTYDTTQDQMKAVLKGFEQVLRDHPAIWPDAMTIRFKGFGPSSLDIDVMAWFMTSDWAKFQEIPAGRPAPVHGRGRARGLRLRVPDPDRARGQGRAAGDAADPGGLAPPVAQLGAQHVGAQRDDSVGIATWPRSGAS